VRVPIPEQEPQDAANEGAAPELAETSTAGGSSVTQGEAVTMAAAGSAIEGSSDQIEFYCPNGHKLHGPVDLAGHAGQCPHCKTKFVIPHPDEAEDEDPDLPFLASGAGAAQAASVSDDDVEEVEEVPSPPPFDFNLFGQSAEPQQHPLVSLFATLWKHRRNGATVEVQLSDGKLLTPDRYAPKLSQGSHAVFVSLGADGRHTLTVVSWEAIHRVTVRGVEDLDESLLA
jgi:hypothetical protein